MSDELNEAISPALQTRGRARQEVGVIIQEELAIAGVTESTFVALREEAQALAALEPANDADIAALQRVITKGTRLCTTICEAIEPGKKWAYALHKAYTSNENEFVGTVKAIIEPLKAKKGSYVARKEQEEREALEAQERVIRARFTALEGFGFTRRTAMAGGDDLYTNGETTLTIAYVTAADDTVWDNVLKGIEMAWNEEQNRKAKEAEAAAQEAERIRLAQEDIERKQREHDEKVAAFNAKINEARANELLALGCERAEGRLLVRRNGAEFLAFSLIEADLHTHTEANWADEVVAAKLALQEKADLDAEAVENEHQRVALQAKLDEADRIENAKRAAEAEEERLLNMGDVEHLDRFYEALSKLGVEMYNQALTSEIAKHGVKKCLPHLDHAMSVINGVLEDLRK